MKTLMQALALLTVLAVPAACNTIEGAGQDVEAVGQETSETAREVEDEITGK